MAHPEGQTAAPAFAKPHEVDLLEMKRELRRRMKAELASIGQADLWSASVHAAEIFRATPAYRDAGILLAFLSMRDEIQTAPLIEAAFADGKRIAVPRMERSEAEGDFISFVFLPPSYLDWPRDRFGIPVPPPTAEILAVTGSAAAPIVVAVPGLAFARNGGRLGRGKGYYDRFLSAARAAAEPDGPAFTACGFCLNVQLVDEVPSGPADQRVDCIVTEKESLVAVSQS